MILVTGGCGFIGSNFILDWLAEHEEGVLNVDALTYAANPKTLASLADDPRYVFVRADIGDRAAIAALFAQYRPRAVVHFAAESHVDRSIHGPLAFVHTNVLGTATLLEACRAHWQGLPAAERAAFRFLHVSTDEVFGSLGPNEPRFTEASQYQPNSPYSASKAGSDHLARAYFHTYGLPVLVTNCSNNYGPRQFPEKLIPLMIVNALAGKPLPVYGDGHQVRDWLYVSDHCSAIRRVLEAGRPGELYLIGGDAETTNLDVVHTLCRLLGERRPGQDFAAQITHVADRPGHDRRYAIDFSKLERELGWRPRESFASGLARTVQWYLDHAEWVAEVQSGAYRDWVDKNYGARLGVAAS
ncbi:MAG: dTDP-glucose 4,6-dehydratase [Burkholderiales bacterium]|nr:dTDP-glucose 4,6-dehydratase [Pseudomonadota bacterium]MCC7069271.1 dTDP-glucose 4,6-dehydratase [Burkholderiales bacterium]